MKSTTTLMAYIKPERIFLLMVLFFSCATAVSQEENPYVTYEVPFQNLLKFNRFLINPTFSTVREDKSYINFFHRNQAAAFDDNRQDYFLSYSGRINDRTGLGLSLYNQQEGVITNIGAMANYAYGVRLSGKSNLTFGVNIPFYHSALDTNDAITTEEDPALADLGESSIIAFQPGLNLSFGQFDIGVFAENLMDYNLKTGNMLTNFSEKTFSGHLQYTFEFENASGIFEEARFMPMARIRKPGQEAFTLGGGMILNLPKLGWLQGGYDSFYGASVGTGFNLNRRLSIGYNIEKGLTDTMDNFGVTHEISLAYSFTPALTENVVQRIAKDTGAYVVEEPTGDSYDQLLKRMSDLENKYQQAQMLLDEMIYRQDSMEVARVQDSERRFELVMRSVKREMTNETDYAIRENSHSYSGSMSVAEYNAAMAGSMMQKVETQVVSTKTDVSRANRFNDPKKLVVRHMVGGSGIPQGHYVVANVFKTQKYLNAFLEDMKSQGLNVDYFTNPQNGLNYVYLARYQDDTEAREAYTSRFGGRYDNNLWIMHVENPRYSNMAKLEFED